MLLGMTFTVWMVSVLELEEEMVEHGPKRLGTERQALGSKKALALRKCRLVMEEGTGRQVGKGQTAPLFSSECKSRQNHEAVQWSSGCFSFG